MRRAYRPESSCNHPDSLVMLSHLRLAGLRVRPSPLLLGARASASSNASPEQAAPSPTEGEQHIINKLNARFGPSRLAVQDVSGTSSATSRGILVRVSDPLKPGGCGTFYAITIASAAFKGLSTVKQHRLVTQELKEEVQDIHGLQVCVPHYTLVSGSLNILCCRLKQSQSNDSPLDTNLRNSNVYQASFRIPLWPLYDCSIRPRYQCVAKIQASLHVKTDNCALPTSFLLPDFQIDA